MLIANSNMLNKIHELVDDQTAALIIRKVKPAEQLEAVIEGVTSFAKYTK